MTPTDPTPAASEHDPRTGWSTWQQPGRALRGWPPWLLGALLVGLGVTGLTLLMLLLLTHTMDPPSAVAHGF